MATWPYRLLLTTAVAYCCAMASIAVAQDSTEVIRPEIDRREIKIAKLDSENIELGPYYGFLNIEDFDSSNLLGVRINYHFTERLFIEASYGEARGDLTTFEELLSGIQLVNDEDRDYRYYEGALGFNLFPNETWLFGKAFNSNVYLVLGAGETDFGGDNWFTFVAGIGYRLFLTDWLAWRIDARDHIFNRDLFGEDDTTNNLEFSSGFTVFF